ncbi:MAG: radical SAM protein [Erysipelotrichaceae bacterium]|nr:radical SAM protein [Erysipelotrichaceae bacterium]
MKLRISEKIAHCEVLGPNKRSVIWVSGCEKHCPGCIAKTYHSSQNGTEEEVADVVRWFLETGDNHLTISGGEPFLQADALNDMLIQIKKVKDIGVIVYTGYKIEELNHPLLNQIDIVIDGEYIETLNDDRPYIGSSNQRLICLTHRYDNVMDYYQSEGRQITITALKDKTILVGVPSRQQYLMWQTMKGWGREDTD